MEEEAAAAAVSNKSTRNTGEDDEPVSEITMNGDNNEKTEHPGSSSSGPNIRFNLPGESATAAMRASFRSGSLRSLENNVVIPNEPITSFRSSTATTAEDIKRNQKALKKAGFRTSIARPTIQKTVSLKRTAASTQSPLSSSGSSRFTMLEKQKSKRLNIEASQCKAYKREECEHGAIRDNCIQCRVKDQEEKDKSASRRGSVVMVDDPIFSLLTEAMFNFSGLNFKHLPIDLRIKDLNYRIQMIELQPNNAPNIFTSSFIYSLYAHVCQLFKSFKSKDVPRFTRNSVSLLHGDMVEKAVLENINLQFQTGKTYLVLGKTGSGVTTLMKAICGILDEDEYHILQGEVTLSGKDKSTKGLAWRNVTTYFDSLDRNLPYLTVQETMEVAFNVLRGTHRTSSTGLDVDDIELVKRLDKEKWLLSLILKSMGIENVKDTFVGDDNVRGVSGGERRRVTVAELLCGHSYIQCIDEMSTGLDAAVTYNIVKFLRNMSKITKHTRIISLQQPSAETFALFDEVIFMDSGRVLYSGPSSQVVDYFESQGFWKPSGANVAEWLLELPTEAGANYCKLSNPPTSRDLARSFSESEFYQRVAKRLGKMVSMKSFDDEKDELFRPELSKVYAVPLLKSAMIIAKRDFILWWRNKAIIKARIFVDIFMGVLIGGSFYQSQEADSILGSFFATITFITMTPLTYIEPYMDSRRIFYKHRKLRFFSPISYVIGKTIAAIPSVCLDVVIVAPLLYALSGYGVKAENMLENFAVYFAIVLVTTMATFQLFSVAVALCKNCTTAGTWVLIWTTVLFLFSGKAIIPEEIPRYYKWAYWGNLFSWSFRALAVNEFSDWEEEEKESILNQYGFTFNGESCGFEWVWYGIGFSVLFYCVMCVFNIGFLYKTRDGSLEIRKTTSKKKEDVRPNALGIMNYINEVKEEEEENDSLEMVDVASDDENGAEINTANHIVFDSVTLTFSDIRYTVKASTTNETLTLLNGISGIIEQGKMTALMGSSGAGKTTLMDVLCFRKTTGRVFGEIKVNGHPVEVKSFKRYSGYVEQFDTQPPLLTVQEVVTLSCKLRLNRQMGKVTNDLLQVFIDETMEKLALHGLRHELIGDMFAGGLNFEQRKRLAVAVELAANPSIIFLDEPTSGLDANAASMVISALKVSTLEGRSVCATIHQPSRDIFNSFDNLLLMKRGGYQVFFGETGPNSQYLIEYLERFDATPKYSFGENPANWMLLTLGSSFDYSKAYAESDYKQFCDELIESVCEDKTSMDLRNLYKKQFAVSYWEQFKIVLRRTNTIYFRAVLYNYVRLLICVFFAFLFGTAFAAGVDATKEKGLTSRVDTLSVVLLYLNTFAFMLCVDFFWFEKISYRLDKKRQMYNATVYVMANSVCEILHLAAYTLVFSIPFYLLVELERSFLQFFQFSGFIFLSLTMWTFTSQVFMGFLPTRGASGSIGALFVQAAAIYAGILRKPQNLAPGLKWLYWLLPNHYVFEGILSTQFKDTSSTVTPTEGTDFFIAVCCGGNKNNTCISLADCKGSDLDYLNATFAGEFNIDNLWIDVTYIVGYLILTRILVYFALKNFK